MAHEVIAYKKALESIASDERYAEVFAGGTSSAGIYAPHESDDQGPHDEDEFYVVLNGSGFFVSEGDREPFGPGDLIFVSAGTEHHFEGFTPDFAVWAIFCPPTNNGADGP